MKNKLAILILVLLTIPLIAQVDKEERVVLWKLGPMGEIISSCDSSHYYVEGWKIVGHVDANHDGIGDLIWWQGDPTQPNAGSFVSWIMRENCMLDWAQFMTTIDIHWVPVDFQDDRIVLRWID